MTGELSGRIYRDIKNRHEDQITRKTSRIFEVAGYLHEHLGQALASGDTAKASTYVSSIAQDAQELTELFAILQAIGEISAIYETKEEKTGESSHG